MLCPVLGSQVQERENYWKESRKGPKYSEGTEAPLLWRKAERAGTFSHRKRTHQGLYMSACTNNYKEEWRKWPQAPFRGVQWQARRQRAQAETQDFPFEDQIPLYYAVDGALAHIAQTVYESPLWRPIEAAFTWSLVNCSGYSFLSRGWTRWYQRSLPTSTSLWFCDFNQNERVSLAIQNDRSFNDIAVDDEGLQLRI